MADGAFAGEDWGRARRTMVDSQLRTVGVHDPRLLARFAVVPRERFVPPEVRALAYADAPVPLGGGRALNPPMASALLVQGAEPRLSDKVLLVGGATGYVAAVLAPLVGRLTVVEERADLLAHARAALPDIAFVEGPLTGGHPAGAPYDLVLIDGAVERMPDALVAQLVPGGRMAAGMIDRGVARLSVGRRAGDGVSMLPLMEAAVAPLPTFARPAEFVF